MSGLERHVHGVRGARDRRRQHDRPRPAVQDLGARERPAEGSGPEVHALSRASGSGFRGFYRGRMLQRNRARARPKTPRRPRGRILVRPTGREQQRQAAVQRGRGKSQTDRMLASASGGVRLVAATDRRHRWRPEGQRDPEKEGGEQLAEDREHPAGHTHHHRVRFLHSISDSGPCRPEDFEQRVRPLVSPSPSAAPVRRNCEGREYFQFQCRCPDRNRGKCG